MIKLQLSPETPYARVSQLSSTGKEPHELLKEFVVLKTQCPSHRKLFDKALQIGLAHGTDMYDHAIDLILTTLKIPIEEVQNMLYENGITTK